MVNQKDILLRIKELLRIKGWSYEKFGASIGKTKETINNYFQGRTKITLDTFVAMLNALGVSPCYFFDCGEVGKNMQIINAGNTVQGDVKQVIAHSHELEREVERLKAELEGYQKLVDEKERLIQLQNEMLQMLKNKQ